MNKAIIGTKLGMSQIFSEDGTLTAVTVIEAGPCTVIQKKTVEKDGYSAIQVGFETVSEKASNKPIIGHCAKADQKPVRYLKELKLDNADTYEVGQVIKADIFAAGDAIDVLGTSKGHGYSGPIARWGQHRGPMAHGSGYHRGVGSMSAHSDPSRVFKNKHMAGHWGCESVTVKNLKVVKVDAERNLILVKGAIPGKKGSFVYLRQTNKG
ncbi:MAG: 50S ribosomal protein L3 [Eubacteriales bacterium]|nr:50S ribosomal protein L3 [Eubacteriales bacterium]